jgi:serine/threonine-protein kinase HipA
VTAPGANGRFELAPAYDVLPTGSGQGYQEFICGEQGHDSTLVNAMSQSTLFGLARHDAAAEVAGVIDVVDGWKEHFAAQGVSQSDIARLARQIDGDELRRQREMFSPSDYAGKPVRRRRSGPFGSKV